MPEREINFEIVNDNFDPTKLYLLPWQSVIFLREGEIIEVSIKSPEDGTFKIIMENTTLTLSCWPPTTIVETSLDSRRRNTWDESTKNPQTT